jgi:Family of unknown function (DUF6152)
MRATLLACVALVALSAPFPAPAHHSTANFDLKKRISFTGTVKYFTFTNPHSFIDMDVVDKSGAVHHYKLASVPKVSMARTGWALGDLKVGDIVSVTSNPDRHDPSYLFLERITFVSGKSWDRDKLF